MGQNIERFSDAAAELGRRARQLERDLARERRWGPLAAVPSVVTLCPVTLTVMALNVAVFIWESRSGALDSTSSLIAAGALVRERVLAGEWWRLLTSTFLHAGLVHLVYNMGALFQLGMLAELILGARGMLVMYATGAVGGSLLSLAFSPGPSVGASGAIFGLWIGFVVSAERNNHRRGAQPFDVALLAVYGALALVQGFTNPRVDNFAHLGGVLGGALAGFFVKVRPVT